MQTWDFQWGATARLDEYTASGSVRAWSDQKPGSPRCVKVYTVSVANAGDSGEAHVRLGDGMARSQVVRKAAAVRKTTKQWSNNIHNLSELATSRSTPQSHTAALFHSDNNKATGATTQTT